MPTGGTPRIIAFHCSLHLTVEIDHANLQKCSAKVFGSEPRCATSLITKHPNEEADGVVPTDYGFRRVVSCLPSSVTCPSPTIDAWFDAAAAAAAPSLIAHPAPAPTTTSWHHGPRGRDWHFRQLASRRPSTSGQELVWPEG